MSTRSVQILEDHDSDWVDLLDQLLKRSQAGPTSQYIDHAARVIRREVSQDPNFRNRDDFNFTTLHDLRGAIQVGGQNIPLAIRTSVTCLSQIGLLLDSICRNSQEAFSHGRSLPLGFGMGQLAAVALALSSGVNDLMELSSVAIVLSFRMGSLAERKLEAYFGTLQDEQSVKWSSICVPIPVDRAREVLREFDLRESSLPAHKRCHLVSFAADQVVISGPTNTVELLNETYNFKAFVKPALPFGIPEFYPEIDLSPLYEQATVSVDNEFCSRTFQFISTASGDLLESTSSYELWECAIQNCLLCPRSITKTLDTLLHFIDPIECKLLVLRRSELSRYILDHIQTENFDNIFLQDLVPTEDEFSAETAAKKPAIAVIGMAGRFPGARDAEEFWQLLEAGRDVHRTVPPDRFNVKNHSDPTGKRKNTSKSPYGCFMDDPGLFDSRFFNMSPKEAAQTDPAQRLMILTAYEALEMAGFVPSRTPASRPDRVATFYGQASDDWREVNSSQDIDTYFIPGGIRAFGPGRINYHLKFSGPSFSVDTACSSSFAALHTACNSLWAGDCDTAITGGANVLTNPDIFSGLSKGYFLSNTGSCKTFDSNADGYCRADGVGSVVLKRLEDAEIDNDNILAVITGIGTNHSADAVSITHPHAPTQASLYQSLLSNNGVDAHDIDYVEMHGTGTAAGDYNEMLSVSDIFAPQHRNRRVRPLFVGSAKANVGHAEAAAGITSIIKVLLMLRENTIPPHVGIKGEINPNFPSDLDQRHVQIALQPKVWKPRADGKARSAFLNNFSAAGGNTSLILQEYVQKSQLGFLGKDTRPKFILTVSAKTIKSMQMNVERLVDFLQANPKTSMANLSYTLTARRSAHPYRKAILASDLTEASKILSAEKEQNFTPIPAKAPKVVFTFTGQGGVYTSLAKSLFESNFVFRQNLLSYDRIACEEGFPSFLALIDGSIDEISDLSPVVTQVGQASVQLALAKLWISWGIDPDAVIGHSLGEYAALAAAGVISEADMIYLVGARATLLQERCSSGSHSMVAVNAKPGKLRSVLADSSLELSCINAPQSTVLGGSKESLEEGAKQIEAAGHRCSTLSLPYAFHTAQVEPMLELFAQKARRVEFSEPTMAVLSPLLGRLIDPGEQDVFNSEYLCRHAREAVNFEAALLSFQDQAESSMFLEIGPHPTCNKFAQQTFGKISSAVSLARGVEPWQTMSESLCTFYEQGSNIDWESFYRGLRVPHRLIDLPSYAWDLKNFWIDYTGNWCLTKGEAPQQNATTVTPTTAPFFTTSIQQIIEENIAQEEGSLVAETDFTEETLQQKAHGHIVNGVALCSSSMYADMAFTVARYLRERIRPTENCPIMDVCAMDIDKPLFLDKQDNRLFRVHATTRGEEIDIQLYTVNRKDGKERESHATCTVRFEDSDVLSSKWNKKSYLIEERIAALEELAASGQAHRIQKALVYRLFANFVDYSSEYQNIEEVILDSPHFEATARVVLQPKETGAQFEIPPPWIDSLTHIAGVILNASDAVDSKSFVYISHGWAALKFLVKPKTGGTYRTYTKMQNTEGTIMEGDVYVFDDQDTIIGLCKGLKFQKIPRKTINMLLPNPGAQALHTTSASSAVDDSEKSSEPLETKPVYTAPVQNGQTTAETSPSDAKIKIDNILELIAAECGIESSELVDGCLVSSLGIDSLLSLEILGRVRERFDLDLRPNVFLENGTIGDFKRSLRSLTGDNAGAADTTDPKTTENSKVTSPSLSAVSESSAYSTDHDLTLPATSKSSSSRSTSVSSLESTDDAKQNPLSSPRTLPKAASYLLSGTPKTASKFLFMFPDGSGSATSYANLPPFPSDTCVYALNCPYMTTPEEWTGGISSVIPPYLNEVRRRKPSGPYNVAGWSAGGILAYEAAKQLQAEGEMVERLILVDSPCPVALPPMPVKMFKFLDSIGLLGSGNAMGTPDWVIPHFDAAVRNLDGYSPAPFQGGEEPRTFAIWARHGVASKTDGKRPPREEGDPAVMEWLLEDRTDFGPNGWEELIPEGSVSTDVMDGHHFNMVNEHAAVLGRLITRAMQ